MNLTIDKVMPLTSKCLKNILVGAAVISIVALFLALSGIVLFFTFVFNFHFIIVGIALGIGTFFVPEMSLSLMKDLFKDDNGDIGIAAGFGWLIGVVIIISFSVNLYHNPAFSPVFLLISMLITGNLFCYSIYKNKVIKKLKRKQERREKYEASMQKVECEIECAVRKF